MKHNVSGLVVLFILVVYSSAVQQNSGRLFSTLSMDLTNDCRLFVDNNDMLQGDRYNVQSDQWNGASPAHRRPAECTVNFNFGDRLIGVYIDNWWCKRAYTQPFFSMYSDCTMDTKHQLEFITCNDTERVRQMYISTNTTCLSLYHYRGHPRIGYYFSLEVIAGQELVGFATGAIAAVAVGSIAGVLLVIKFICVITGWEGRLPRLREPRDVENRLLGGGATGGDGMSCGSVGSVDNRQPDATWGPPVRPGTGAAAGTRLTDEDTTDGEDAIEYNNTQDHDSRRPVDKSKHNTLLHHPTPVQPQQQSTTIVWNKRLMTSQCVELAVPPPPPHSIYRAAPDSKGDEARSRSAVRVGGVRGGVTPRSEVYQL